MALHGERVKAVAKAVVPEGIRRWLRRVQKALRLWPPVGHVHFGSLRRLTPISRVFGFDRGQPIDRYYIEEFLQENCRDIAGQVLEVADAHYTRRFGGDRVTKSDVLHAVPGNPQATLVGDLATGQGIPENAFDCIIMTQVFQLIYDIKAAVATAHLALRPSGVLLATFTGISPISRYDMDRWGEYWHPTSRAVQRLFEAVFPPQGVRVQAHGNVLAAIAFLHGLAAEDLRKNELQHSDPDYELVITVRAVKS
jgi:hypothetical protein